LALENFAFFCVKVFALENIVVVSAAPQFEDFVEAPAAIEILSGSLGFHPKKWDGKNVSSARKHPVKTRQKTAVGVHPLHQNLIFA
jgi:hypothetical protein